MSVGPPPLPSISLSTSTIAILAGGAASRMGGLCKSFLMVDGQRIIDRQLAVMRPLFSHIVIVANDARGAFADLGLPVIPDRAGAGLGPVAGLDAALAWRPTTPLGPGAADDEDVVCVAGDMPFLSEPLLRRLRDHPAGRGVIPHHDGQFEPLCARYPRSAAAQTAAFLRGGGRALHMLAAILTLDRLEEVELRAFSPNLTDFTNVNDPDDLMAIES